MKPRSILSLTALGAIAVVAGLWSSDRADAMGRGRVATYEIAVTNLTRGQVLSPPFAVAHSTRAEPLWTVGRPASAGLAAIAEDADAAPLTAALTGAEGIATVMSAGGPIPPGQTGTFTIEVRGGRNVLSLVSMLVQTNDAFIGLRGVSLPRGRGEARAVTYRSPAYDAGSEANNEDAAFIPGPPFGSAGVRATEDAEGFVHIHAGVHGIADLNPATYDWRNPTAQIRITRVR